MIEDPAIITCAISGAIANRDQCPAIPYTPPEYAAEARRIVDEGGVHIHIHARQPDGTPSYEIEDFRAIRDAIVEEIGDALEMISAAAGGNIAIGPVLLGAAKPDHILTASATVRRIVNMTALTVSDANADR